MQIKLAKTKKLRREQLKSFLRNHAKQFDMSWWIKSTGADEVTTSLREGGTVGAVYNFERCGTTCCIGGAAALLAGSREDDWAKYGHALKKMGFDLGSNDPRVFYTGSWPAELERRYSEAFFSEQHSEAVEVAIEALDFFQENPDFVRPA